MMNHATMTNTPSVSLQSKDHGQLLDVIDLLRSQGISHYVPLPQLIVCGDQSSGKSSVLEAVSGVRFPTKDSLCTRFATELILRRGPTASAKLAIVPGAERSDEEKEKLLNFKVPTASIDEFPSLIDKAKEAMGLNSDTKAFSDDVLRVEISGPDQPHLTLVDLPGVIHAENKQQSVRDVELVSSLVRSYMANSRSIILAVVSARNDYANQIVTKLARNVDPKGLRTLGIITKPDTLHVGSESEKAFLSLAKNEDVIFRLGWHVLRNRDYTERECSLEERDQAETDLFSQGIWTSLPTSSLGIGTLKLRLSTVLRDQIVSEMPSLVRDVEAGIEECRSRLARLGEARGTLQEQRLYLIRISQSFSSLVKAAVGGVYVHDFFGDATNKAGHSKRLRAVIQNFLVDFAEDMRREGHDQDITEDTPIKDDESVPRRISSESVPRRISSESVPRRISRSDFIESVRELMRRSRGCELVGTFNPLIVGDLFYQQSKPWKRLVERYCENILEAARFCLKLVLIEVADETTRDGLLREIIEPAMDRITKELRLKVSEIMRPHQRGHPITYNHYFTDTIQKARQEHERKNMIRPLNAFFKLKPQTAPSYIQPQGFNTADLLDSLTQRTEKDPDRYACSEAVDCMEAYYEVAMKLMVDNFAILGIEYCLLDGLSDILSPDTVIRLDEKLTREIAAETEDSQTERVRSLRKLGRLEAGFQNLKHFSRQKIVGYDLEDDLDWAESKISLSDDDADMKEVSAQEQENRPAQEAKSPDIGDAVPLEPAVKLSPFNGNGAPRPDDFWLGNKSKNSNKKKGKRIIWPDEGPL